jgi:hypothetical protein
MIYRTKTLSGMLFLLVLALTTTILLRASKTHTVAATITPACVRGTFKSSRDTIPAGWNGPVFQLSQDYPDALPSPETYPWKTIDYKTDPLGYMIAVRNYAFQGNVDPSNPNAPWVIQNNPVRKWYHAPWMDAGTNGREFIHGLTRELASVPGQLWTNPPQNGNIQNWAVGFYNPPGGYTFGQVWCDPQNPSLSPVSFPDGTVSAKLLFSAGPLSQVPILKGSVEWTANINTVITDPTSPRKPQTVRLLQIDLSVRDSRNTDTGWNFGTLIYDAANGSQNPWENMQPVGLMWGDDPGVTPSSGSIKQSWLNPAVATLMQHYGWAERLNGPVDNPLSSCLSCHATAGWPAAPLTPPTGSSNQQRLAWFRNIKAGQPFQPGQSSQDYSLQLTFGMRQFKAANPGGPVPMARMKSPAKPQPEINRAGEPEAQFRKDVLQELRKRKMRKAAKP